MTLSLSNLYVLTLYGVQANPTPDFSVLQDFGYFERAPGENSPTAVATNTVMPNYQCMGCYIGTLARVLSGGEKVSNRMTNQLCADTCADSAFYGTESGQSCHCGSALAASVAWATEWSCNAQCRGVVDYCLGRRFAVGGRVLVFGRRLGSGEVVDIWFAPRPSASQRMFRSVIKKKVEEDWRPSSTKLQQSRSVPKIPKPEGWNHEERSLMGRTRPQRVYIPILNNDQ
jgi:hypothetical protein